MYLLKQCAQCRIECSLHQSDISENKFVPAYLLKNSVMIYEENTTAAEVLYTVCDKFLS